jgi:ATP-dependent DNA helicase RecQ
MCARLPLNRDAMLMITGVGEVKFERYGPQFLEVIRRYVEDPGSIENPDGVQQESHKKSRSSKKKPENKPDGEKIPSHLLTWQQFREGMSLPEIAQERDLQLWTIQGHLLRAAAEGHEVDWDQFITPRQEDQILKAARELGVAKLSPIKQALPGEISYFMIRIALFKNGMTQQQDMEGGI